jgi:hypothetical protein
MNGGDPMRRSFPPPRRPPTVLDILIRWRVEIATAVGIGFTVEGLGTTVSGLLGCTVALLAAFVPPVRRVFVRLLLPVVVTHRVRVALVESGVTSRNGKLPWLVFARSHGQVVMVHVWLRGGTTWEDLDRAIPVIRSACGAVDVQVARFSARHDRAVIMVARPRWGWPGR